MLHQQEKFSLCKEEEESDYYKYKHSDETGTLSEQGDRQSRFQPVPSFIVPCPRCLPRFTRPNVAQRDVKERHKRENLATSLVRTMNVVQLLACDASKASLACLENVCSRFLNRRHEGVTTVTPVMGTLRNARDD